MEGLWDYFYWQALSTNPLDDTGHVLRLTALVNQCSTYQTKRTGAAFDSCNQWLGPHQPGVNAPDPTEINGEAGAASSSRRTPASRKPTALRRQPASAPSPASGAPRGGRSPAAPKGRAPALPEGVRKLLDPLTRRKPSKKPAAPASGDVDVPLLDYLFSP
jgi:hypothetical protein